MTSTSPSAPEHPVSLVAGILSYLVPGLGQIYQGRIGKGVLFMVCLLSLFFTGQAMGGWKNVYIPTSDPPAGANGNGFAPPQDVRQRRFSQLIRNLYQRWHYVGQFWIGVAAWPAVWQYNHYERTEDTGPVFGHFQREIPEQQLNQLQTEGGKRWDLGWVYTVIAGVLNILVIYDAFAGPTFLTEPRPAPRPEGVPAT